MTTILIDPGHGGSDSGALGPNDEKESDIVLAVALKLRESLQRRGFSVEMTRTADVYPSLNERVAQSNRINPDLFLSIHANAAGGHGHEVFTSPGHTKSDPIATAIFEAYSKVFPHLPPRQNNSDGDPDKEARFKVLTKTNAPAVLYELEFIDTARGIAFLNNATNQARMAEALAIGIEDHFGPQDVVSEDSGSAPYETFEEKAPRIMRDLIGGFSLTTFQAAGILGNIGHECNGFRSMQEIKPRAGQGGWGWCQWTGVRRRGFEQWAEDRDLDVASDEANYGFLVHELKTTERRALAALKETRNIDEATQSFMLKVERPGVKHLASRIDWAYKAEKAFWEMTSFGAAVVKSEGTSVTYDEASDSNVVDDDDEDTIPKTLEERVDLIELRVDALEGRNSLEYVDGLGE